MHQTRKGNQWYFGMKAHVGVDAESGLIHTMVGTAANVADVTQAHDLLHGEEAFAFGDAGYTGVAKRTERRREIDWHVAMKPGKRRRLGKTRLGRLGSTAEVNCNQRSRTCPIRKSSVGATLQVGRPSWRRVPGAVAI